MVNGVDGVTDQVPPEDTRVVAMILPEALRRVIVAPRVHVPEKLCDREDSPHARLIFDTGEMTGVE
jgi:hypothetical protein